MIRKTELQNSIKNTASRGFTLYPVLYLFNIFLEIYDLAKLYYIESDSATYFCARFVLFTQVNLYLEIF